MDWNAIFWFFVLYAMAVGVAEQLDEIVKKQ
jgi:hypothetical protein